MPQSAVRICLAGSISISNGGAHTEERGLGGARGRLLFAVLVLTRRHPLRIEQIADVLWPDDLPPSWKSAVRTVGARIRSFVADAGLPTSMLTARSGSYQLHFPERATVDLEAAAADLAAANRAVTAGRFGHAAARAAAALSAFDLPFLPGLENDWIEARRVELRRAQIEALEVLANARVELGQNGGAVADAERLLAIDPFRETAYRSLMRAHDSAGNRAQAVRAYERCRALLAEELGIAPSPSTQDVYAALLQRDRIGSIISLAGALRQSSPTEISSFVVPRFE
jgi:DNA-binding SARP family transcriptional activator